MEIREYKTEDREQVEDLVVLLQDYEAAIIPGMKSGKEMAAEYFDKAILKDCPKKNGKIFVAEVDSKIVGFIWGWVEKEPRDLMYYEPVSTFIYVGDYIVLNKYRKQGIGAALNRKIEEYAKKLGIDQIKLHVLSKNNLAREVYKKLGFEDEEIILVKKVSSS